MAQWASRVKNFGTRVVVLGLAVLEHVEVVARRNRLHKTA